MLSDVSLGCCRVLNTPPVGLSWWAPVRNRCSVESILGCSSCLLRQLTGPQNLWLPLSKKKTERRGCCFCLVCVPSVGASPPRLSSSSWIPAPRETNKKLERLLSILPPQAVLFLRRQRPALAHQAWLRSEARACTTLHVEVVRTRRVGSQAFSALSPVLEAAVSWTRQQAKVCLKSVCSASLFLRRNLASKALQGHHESYSCR